MSAQRIWLVVGLVAVFAAGFAAGILYHRAAPLTGGGPGSQRHDAAHFLDYFRKRLDLTDEQAREVSGVLDRLHAEMGGLGADFHNRFIALRSGAWTDIRAALGERQRSEFEKLVEEMEKEHSHHAGFHGKESGHGASNGHQGD